MGSSFVGIEIEGGHNVAEEIARAWLNGNMATIKYWHPKDESVICSKAIGLKDIKKGFNKAIKANQSYVNAMSSNYDELGCYCIMQYIVYGKVIY